MKLKLILTIIIILSNYKTFSQCNCIWTGDTHQIEPEVFHNFKKGCVVGICSPIYWKDNQKDYSNSAIMDCSNNEIISDFQKGEKDSIAFEKDTLSIYTFYELPIGKDYQNVNCLFQTRTISCDSERVNYKDIYNSRIKLYNQDEINIVLEEFDKMKKSMSDEEFDIVSNKLLICYLSGSDIALIKFLEIKNIVLNWNETKEYQLNMIILPRYEKFRKYLKSKKE